MDAETLYLLTKSQGQPVTVLYTSGPPTTGTWFPGALALDSTDVLWICSAGGSPGTWVPASSPWLSPVSRSANTAATNGQYIEATASITVQSPAAVSGNRFAAIADYAASNASPVTVTAASGYLIGPGIPASTSSILLGAQGANVSFVCDGTNWVQTQGAQDTGWVTLTLINSWIGNVFYRIVGNRVMFSGYLSLPPGTSGTAIFDLPAAQSPFEYMYFPLANDGTGNCYARTPQAVDTSFIVEYTGSPSHLFLDVVSYTVG